MASEFLRRPPGKIAGLLPVLSIACAVEDVVPCTEIGSRTFESLDELLATADIACIQGDVRVDLLDADGTDRSVELHWSEVQGSVAFRGFATSSQLRFPSLTSVSGHLSFQDSPFQRLDLPLLVAVGGSLTLTSATELTSLRLPSLDEVDGNVSIQNCDALTLVELGAERLFVGASLQFSENESIEVIDLQDLEIGGGVEIIQNARLASAIGPESANPLTLVEVRQNPELLEISGFGSESVTAISINLNPSLVEISAFADATEIGALTLTYNSSFSRVTGFRRVGLLHFLFAIYNGEISSDEIIEALAGATPSTMKVGGNRGDTVPYTGDCPWSGDGICDEAETREVYGTGLCARDPDCSRD